MILFKASLPLGTFFLPKLKFWCLTSHFFSLNRSRLAFRLDTIYKPFLKNYIYKHIEHWPTWKSHHLVKATKALEKYSKTLAFSRKFSLASTMRQSCNGVMVTRWGDATFHHLRQRWGIVVASFHLKEIEIIMKWFFFFFQFFFFEKFTLACSTSSWWVLGKIWTWRLWSIWSCQWVGLCPSS